MLLVRFETFTWQEGLLIRGTANYASPTFADTDHSPTRYFSLPENDATLRTRAIDSSVIDPSVPSSFVCGKDRFHLLALETSTHGQREVVKNSGCIAATDCRR